MRARRVLQILNNFPPRDLGGAEVAAYNGCRGLIQRGVEVSVLVVHARQREEVDRHYEIQGIPVHQVDYRPYKRHVAFSQVFDRRAYRVVLSELNRFRPGLVHVHNVSGASLAPFVACRRLGVPVVLTLHDHWLLCPNNMLYKADGSLCDPAVSALSCSGCYQRWDFWGNIPWRRRVFAWLVRDVRRFISPSQKLVDLHAAAGYDRSRFRVVPYGIETGLYKTPTDPRTRRIVSSCGLFRTLLFAGAAIETKGIGILYEAFLHLSKQIDRLRLVVAGSGDERFLDALRQIDPSGERIYLLGRLPFQEMRALYATADLTVVPSTWYDNSPMVIYESFLAGTPVLGSEIGGIPELIQEGITGYLSRPGDASMLSERVIQHLTRPALERRAMRRQCAAYARRHMVVERHIDRLQQVYDEVLGESQHH
ncbi:MAG: glycosyltransferase family 4 protein [Anaerolineae bacterium]|nr:glycosyltransferase family 4 protein [Anaerolineae bacterium]